MPISAPRVPKKRSMLPFQRGIAAAGACGV
jgi:hypothetical protein